MRRKNKGNELRTRNLNLRRISAGNGCVVKPKDPTKNKPSLSLYVNECKIDSELFENPTQWTSPGYTFLKLASR